MQHKIFIPENTDLNQLISEINSKDEVITFNQETLVFDQWIYQELPYPLSLISKDIEQPFKRDIALISLLTLLSGVFRKYQISHDYKFEGCQLFSYILSNPAQGKGFASIFEKVGDKINKKLRGEYLIEKQIYNSEIKKWKNDEIDEEPKKPDQKKLFVASDNTKAALARELYENEGFGLIFETETDTLTTANRSEHGGFSEILRKGFHGEKYQANRVYFKDESILIDSLKVSIFLTSTLDQCFKLIPSYENGLFSRFIFYFLPTDSPYNSPYKNDKSTVILQMIDKMADSYLAIAEYERQSESNLIFSFSEQQKKRYDNLFSTLRVQFKERKNEHLLGNLNRIGLIFSRMCMLLTYLRKPQSFNTIQCDDIDFNICMTIVSKLIQHLQIMDYLYKSKQKNYNEMMIIPHTTKDVNKEICKLEKLKVKDLINAGQLSQREISEKVWGDKNHCGTVNKWKKKLEDGTLFPFPETETPTNIIGARIGVSNVLKDTDVSLYENVFSSTVLEDSLPLFDLITAKAYKEDITALRNAIENKKKEKIKSSLLAFTPSGLFNKKRSKNTLDEHSLFICIDIDEKGNEQIMNFDQLKKELSKIINVAFCAHSVSGKGFYLLVPIASAELHEEYFDALYLAFKKLGIEIDKSCRDVSRLRIISYDEEYYMADWAVPINETFKSIEKKVDFIKPDVSIKKSDFLLLVEMLKESGIDITDKKKYVDWRDIAYAIANTFGEQGREDFHTISENYTNYNKKKADYQFTACLKDTKNEKRIGLKRVFEIAKENGVYLKSNG